MDEYRKNRYTFKNGILIIIELYHFNSNSYLNIVLVLHSQNLNKNSIEAFHKKLENNYYTYNVLSDNELNNAIYYDRVIELIKSWKFF